VEIIITPKAKRQTINILIIKINGWLLNLLNQT